MVGAGISSQYGCSMKEMDRKTAGPQGRTEPENTRWFFRFLLVLLGGTLVTVASVWFLTRAQLGAPAISPSVTPQRIAISNAALPHSKQTSPGLQHSQPVPTTKVFWNAVAPEMRALVKTLTDLKPENGALTAKQSAEWRSRLQNLIDQGAAGVPAVREYLTNNLDLDFNGSAKTALGYSSVRSALFDALTQIGGAEAEAVLGEVLQTTADPREISAIAKDLAKLNPGAHESEVLDAARQTLAMSADGNLQGRDVGPLFELFQNLTQYGAIDDLTRNASRWNYYSMISLAQMPQEAGVPALIQFAQGSGGSEQSAQMAAVQMLCQVAGQSQDARAALVEMAQNNKISPYWWNTMVSYLAGDRMVLQSSVSGNTLANVDPNDWRKTQISATGQSYITAPLGAMTLDQITQQRELVNQLLAVTTDAAGKQALQNAQNLLQRRAGQLTNSQNPG
jgi:hypothetical protein